MGVSGRRAYEISLYYSGNFFLVNFELVSNDTTFFKIYPTLSYFSCCEWQASCNANCHWLIWPWMVTRQSIASGRQDLWGGAQRWWEWGERKEERGCRWGGFVTWLSPPTLIADFFAGVVAQSGPFELQTESHQLSSCMVGSVWVAANEEKVEKVEKIEANGKKLLSKYIFSLFTYNPSNRITKRNNKSQPPPGNLPSPSVPKSGRNHGSGISPIQPAQQWTPAASPTSGWFRRLW